VSSSVEQLVDEILVMDCQTGSVKALEMLVSRWQKRLWRYACRLTGEPEAAWDVTQESWLGIVRGIYRLNDPARFRPWAYRIVTNKAHDWIRKDVRAPQVQADRITERQSRSKLQSSETLSDLQNIMRRLSTKSRDVLTLYYLEEFRLAEVASILRIPKGTVKSRLHNARNELKKLWQEYVEE
jgi:RNA polymerase sigma-70 factor (ECF subfamily)